VAVSLGGGRKIRPRICSCNPVICQDQVETKETIFFLQSGAPVLVSWRPFAFLVWAAWIAAFVILLDGFELSLSSAVGSGIIGNGIIVGCGIDNDNGNGSTPLITTPLITTPKSRAGGRAFLQFCSS
jgi:hypothetical protein